MLIRLWHSFLNMPKYDLAWHQQDIKDEVEELREAKGFIGGWSEISGVVYTYTRARWSGHKDLKWPFSKWNFIIGLIYMFPKYTFRWLLFRKAGKILGSKKPLTEVRNPEKLEKLGDIAKRYELDEEQFKKEIRNLLKHWILLK